MISEREIAANCNSRTFARAERIAASDRNILTKRVRYEVGETVLSAQVASSSGWDDHYRASVYLSPDEETVEDWSCTCPAVVEYDGLCKHCAALALSFSRAPEKFMGYTPKRRVATSACITELMRRGEQFADDSDMEGSIDLECTLTYGYRLWSASFKVASPTSSYVMKSISDFVSRMRAGERYSYGKKLAFTHTPALLTERGRRVAEFLDRAVSLREQSVQTTRWGIVSTPGVGRDINLSEVEVVELLDALDGGSFTIRGTDIGTRSVTETRIVHADPEVKVSLEKSTEDGYCIERGSDVVLAAQGRRLYLWMGDVVYRCSPELARCADFLRMVYEGSDARLFISKEDMPLFCSAVLPQVEKVLHMDMPPEVERFRPVPGEISFYFDKVRAGVRVEAVATYGDFRYVLAGEEAHLIDASGVAAVSAPVRRARAASAARGIALTSKTESTEEPGPLRDARLEARATTLVERYFGLGDPIIPNADDDAVGNLLFGGLPEFRALGEVFTTPAFDRLIRDGKPRISMGVSLAGNLIDLTVSAGDLESDELAALLSSYRKRKHYHRLKGGAYLSLEDMDLAELDRIASDLGISLKELASGKVELPSYRAFYLDEEKDLDRDRSFKSYVDNFRSVDEQSYTPPAQLSSVLRPYQEEGFRWLSARCDAGFGGILADEMGLGKSLQLISLLLARRDEARRVGPSLIVCPASLVYNWLQEFARFAPELTVRAVAGPKAERRRIRALSLPAPDGSAATDPCDVLVTSYDLLRIDIHDWVGERFFLCALDEAQYVKNPAALVTRAVKRVEAEHRFALTGTPMENRLSELWSIFDFLMPGLLGPYARFRERFELPIVGGDEDIARRLQALVGPFMLRRLKTQVLSDLPEKLESVVYAPMTGEQLKLYSAHEQRLREELTRQKSDKAAKDGGRKSGMSDAEFNKSKVQILAELTRLRQLCCDPRLLYENYKGPAAKLDAICDLVDSAMGGGEKALVFSQFTSFLSLIADKLDAAGVRYFTITGATPKEERLELVNRFNADDTPVFLISLKAGGTGLNLTGASVVIHADPWWNAAAQDQATDRAHRIGQTHVVSVERVIAKGTIEERILALQEAKSDLADQVVGASGVSLASLSRDDLVDLLSPVE